MNKIQLNLFKIISILFFLLFLIEVIFLNHTGLSFRGLYTEKLFFWGSIICGFIGFSLKKFGMMLGIFIGITMLPMMFPFLMLLAWSTSINTHFYQEEGERIEEVAKFGQNSSELVIIKPINFFLEKIYFKTYLNNCDIENLNQVEDVQMEIIKLETSSKIEIKYAREGVEKICEIEIL